MKNHQIATIINYCTNDYRFLDLCIGQAKQFSQQVIIPVCDHFFNGTLENRKILNRSYQEHPDCTFVEFHYDAKHPYGLYCPLTPSDDDWIHYWHSTARYVGYHYLKEEIDSVLFLDVDEIIDSRRFIAWIDAFDYQSFEALRFYSYFYFRKPTYRAKTYPLNALMIKKTAIQEPETLLNIYERKGVFEAILGSKMNNIVGLDDQPLVHHYSWVKEKEELELKIKSWGHHYEKDWQSLLEKEFSDDFSGSDALYGLSYEHIAAVHDPLKQENIPLTECSPAHLMASDFPHVQQTTSSSLFRLNIQRKISF